jgi:hypothetical protein
MGLRSFQINNYQLIGDRLVYELYEEEITIIENSR